MDFSSPPVNLVEHPLKTRIRILVGTGPSTVSQRVLNVMCRPLMGPTCPETYAIMDEIKDGCRYIFQTQNKMTLCLSTSGHGGMEASLSNLIERDDTVLIGVTGLWGQRAADMAQRYGANVRLLKAARGMALTLDSIEEALRSHRPTVLFLVHGDTSTGILQPLEGVGQLCRRYNTLFVVDAVSTVCGTYFYGDRWLIDVMYTTSQKVLGAPPGITPISFSERAMKWITNRKTKSCVYYWDVTTLGDHWGCTDRQRFYHHTVSSPILCAFREALADICREGLHASIERHINSAKRFQKGVESLGLKMYIEAPNLRLPTINVINVPNGVDSQHVFDYAMEKYSLEIADGIGPTKSKVLRVGLMGHNANIEMVDLILDVLTESLEQTSTFQRNKFGK